jgi:erythromycin esterase-like protein
VELPDDVVRSPAALCTAAHVVQYLSQVDPEAASRVKARYKCFDRYGADTMAYAYAVSGLLSHQATAQLLGASV